MCDRSMRSGTKLAREIQLTDWSTARNLSNRSSGVQIPRDICTRFWRYLYSTKCSWIIKEYRLTGHKISKFFQIRNDSSFGFVAAFYFRNKIIKLLELKLTSQNKRHYHSRFDSVNQLVAFLTSVAPNWQRHGAKAGSLKQR